MKKNVLKGIFITSMTIIILLLFLYVIYNKMAVQSSAEEIVDDNFNKMIEYNSGCNILSSNPYDYVDNEFYNNIVELGFQAIPILDDKISSNELPGCYQYVACIAIQEISEVDIAAFNFEGWETADEFIFNWNSLVEEMPAEINNILSDTTTDNKEKIEKIEAYGKLAEPILTNIADGNSDINSLNIEYDLNDELTDQANTVLSNKEIDSNENKIILSYIESRQNDN